MALAGARGWCSNKCRVSNKHWPLIDARGSKPCILINARGTKFSSIFASSLEFVGLKAVKVMQEMLKNPS